MLMRITLSLTRYRLTQADGDAFEDDLCLELKE